MAYAMVSQNHGVSIDTHHALQQELGDESVEGLIATYAGTGPEGLCVISVWETKAHADRFTTEQLIPALERLGFTPDPTRRSLLEIDLDDVPVG